MTPPLHPPRSSRLPLIAAALAAALLAVLVFSTLRVRADMSDFVPAGENAATRFLREEIRSGAATSLILVGIEGAPVPELARLSDALADALRRSGEYAFVANGRDAVTEAELAWLFRHRYLLSPAVTAEGFSAEALRAGMERLLAGLHGAAAPLLERYGFADPTGAFLAMARNARGSGEIQTREGVWFAPDKAPGRERVLLIARMAVGGLDIKVQDRALAAIQNAWTVAKPGPARLLLAGPAVFSHDAAHAIRSDVRLLSIVSTILVMGLLVWRFRSPWVMAAIAVPILLSVSAAALAVQLTFGFVHGITLGFGMTMLGVSVDYPVLLIGHRKRGEAAPATLRRIGAAFNLAVVTAALGLTGMTFSSFPGLSQLGVFSVVGVLTAAAATRWLLPPLIVRADLAPVSAGDPARLLWWERARTWRLAALPVVGGAAAVLAFGGAPRAQTDIAALSPVPVAARALDEELRRDLGVPDTGLLLVVRGADAETVLRREEALLPRFAPLIRDKILAGAEAAALSLPSVAAQEAHRAALPDEAMLAASLTAAARDLPFTADAFDDFRNDARASRTLPPVRPEMVESPLLREKLAPLLFARGGNWFGILVPRGVTDPAGLTRAVPDGEDATWVNMRAEADQLLLRATGQAWRWLLGGAVAAVLALMVALRDIGRVARVAGAVTAALTVTVAVLGLSGARLSLLHIVSLQLVAGVGLNYALFFARRQLDEEERSRTLRTLVTCNAMSLMTFGLLGFCHTPLLRDIGVTTAAGVVAAMVFAFLFAGETGPVPVPREGDA